MLEIGRQVLLPVGFLLALGLIMPSDAFASCSFEGCCQYCETQSDGNEYCTTMDNTLEICDEAVAGPEGCSRNCYYKGEDEHGQPTDCYVDPWFACHYN